MKSKTCYLKTLFFLFHIVYIISSALGLAPCGIKISRGLTSKIGFTCVFSYSSRRCAYNLLLIMLFIAITIAGVPHLHHLSYPNNSPAVRVITVALSVMGNVVAIVIITFYLITQRDIISIGNQLNEFDEKYGDRLVGRRDTGVGDFQSLITVIIITCIWIAVVTSEMVEAEGEIFLLTSGPSEAFVSWLLIQYSLLINVLQARFEGLNNALFATFRPAIILKEGSFVRRSIFSDTAITQSLLMCKQARNRIYKVSCKVSRFYSFPALIGIFYCCCCFVDTIYFYIMTLIYLENSGRNQIDPIFWTLVTLYPIVALSTSVNTFQTEEARTMDIIYDIMEAYAPNKDIESELNNFAVELLHKNVPFNACALFSLDCSLLHSIFAMTVTYLLILVQFKPPESHKSTE
ncbi:uncharacterized protein LOC135161346 [Diachasmimorpha longicaudata]|uniref:uncharacterized protein LOC135161346 n=1 Tax=Diachasmimorpha longicaudata TaxID=58733 RepID=UPI0030B8D66D